MISYYKTHIICYVQINLINKLVCTLKIIKIKNKNMFPSITKSRYLFFCKIGGLKNNPSANNNVNSENCESINIEEVYEFEDNMNK